jgi:hypothetical protein
MAASGPLYSDCDINIVSDRHIIVKYNPEFSDDFAITGRTCPYPVENREVWGRVILLAIPPGGEISYNVNFSQAGMTSPVKGKQYISAEMPLVMQGPSFNARGHSLVRLVIFPQRMENGNLAVYKDFEIEVFITSSGQSVDLSPPLSRLDSVLAGGVINPDQFYRFGTAVARRTAQKAAVNLFAEVRDWVRIAVNESGVTRVTGAALAGAGVNLTNLHSDSIRLFYSGGVNPPDSLLLPEPELSQVAIKVEDGGDGIFGSGDYFLFYAEGPDRFEFETGVPVYVKNNYHSRNYYWLAIDGIVETPLRWTWKDGRPDDSAQYQVITGTRQTVRFEQENMVKVDGDGRIRNYFDWFWSDKSTETVSVNLPYLIPGDSVDIRMRALSSFNSTALSLNGTSLSKVKIGDNYFRFWDVSGAAVSGINTLRIDIYHVSGYYLDFLEIDYLRQLHHTGSQMTFDSRGLAGIMRYTTSGYTPSDYVIDITDPDYPATITGVEIMGDTAQFQRPESSIGMSRYLIYSLNSALSPVAVEDIDPGDLRRDLTQYDCIAIAPRSFLGAMEDYVNYRFETDRYRVKLVAVEDAYNCFGYGLQSPMAIRNYLKFAYNNYDDPAPFAVLLVGDGHHDYLDNLGHHSASYIPPFIWAKEYSVGDDNYVYFNRYSWLDSDSSYVYEEDRGWDMMIARWPIRSSSEIAAYIESVKNYESPENQGNWRTRVTYVADDEFKGPISTEIIHTAMAETLAVYHTPSEFMHQKIYVTDYPFASNGEKPTANDAIVKAINDGTLIVDYIGHGSPDVWADEHVFKKSVDLSRMKNNDKLMIVIAGSCSIGFFDDPAKEGMAEIMFRQQGGALETVSATRLVYATDNAIFNYDLFDAFFGNHCNISEAVYTAKVMHQYSYNFSLVRNDRSFVVFGDPLGRVGLPEYELHFEVDPDSLLTPLEHFSFTGSVSDRDGNPLAVDGQLEIAVYDSRFLRHHELGIDYSLDGPSIFRGIIPVESGVFEGGFVVPLDVDYGGTAAHLTGYGAFGGISGLGGVDSLSIAVSAATTTDNSGPEIVYEIDEIPDFVSGGRLPANATIIVGLNDESGINLTGGLGHRIELVVDNDNNTTVNLTDLFAYIPGSYQSGEIRFTLPDLSPERHSFKIRAWDNANNPAVIEFEAIPAQEGRIALHEVLNYPNPMEEDTEFFFDLSEAAEWVELRIFTVAGRMIKDFRIEDLPVGRNRGFNWDGRDLDGDRVAEGVYIYKITAKGHLAVSGRSADNMAEAFGKLVLLN